MNATERQIERLKKDLARWHTKMMEERHRASVKAKALENESNERVGRFLIHARALENAIKELESASVPTEQDKG